LESRTSCSADLCWLSAEPGSHSLVSLVLLGFLLHQLNDFIFVWHFISFQLAVDQLSIDSNLKGCFSARCASDLGPWDGS
jgi:hypothetical protein